MELAELLRPDALDKAAASHVAWIQTALNAYRTAREKDAEQAGALYGRKYGAAHRVSRAVSRPACTC